MRSKRQSTPTAARGSQPPLVRERDPQGRIVLHHRRADTLDRLFTSGTIDTTMLEAGRRFERTLARAALDPLRAADLDRVIGSRGPAEPADHRLDARRHLHRALAALGGPTSPAGSCAWAGAGAGALLAAMGAGAGLAGAAAAPGGGARHPRRRARRAGGALRPAGHGACGRRGEQARN